MAEGVDNDMNQQQQQDGVPHGQEALHSPSVHFESTALNATSTPSIEVTVSSAQSGVNQGPKKKSAFQITSVTETRAHSRGDSNGYDVEDLNESDVTEIQVETIEDSSTGNGNGGSRFKVVKIQKKEPYKRGRWLCHDSEQPTTSFAHNADGREVHSTSTASSNIFASNHVSCEASNAIDPSISNHKNTVEVTFNYKTGQTPSVASTNPNLEATVLRKRESEPSITGIKYDQIDLSSLVSGKTSFPTERIEKLAETARLPSSSSQSEGAVSVGDELPIVNTIANAMDKISEIKSALLTVVHEEVQTLKDTITKLREENEELKEQNEKLKQIVDSTTMQMQT